MLVRGRHRPLGTAVRRPIVILRVSQPLLFPKHEDSTIPPVMPRSLLFSRHVFEGYYSFILSFSSILDCLVLSLDCTLSVCLCGIYLDFYHCLNYDVI